MEYESSFKLESVLIIESKLKCKRLAKVLNKKQGWKQWLREKSSSLYSKSQFD